MRSDNIRFFISSNDGAYLVTAQHNYRSSGWLTGLYYLVNDSKSISLYVGILNYPADVGAKLVFNGLDGAEITGISTVSALPSGYATMKQFPVIYTADLTSSVTSGSNAPITSGGVASAFNYKSGTVNFSCVANDWTTVNVTFDSPMPDADYVITLESGNATYVHVQNVTTKTSNGFIIIVWNRDSLTDSQGIINWQAYKIPH